MLAIRLPSLPPRAGRTPPIRLTLGLATSLVSVTGILNCLTRITSIYLVTQMGVPKRVQDELRARLLPVECDADINRIFIHTEGSVRARARRDPREKLLT